MKRLSILSLILLTQLQCLDQGILANFLNIKMLLVFEEPTYVKRDDCNTDWFEPYSVGFTLKSAVLTYRDGNNESETLTLTDADLAGTKFDINNRLQKIVSSEINTSVLGVDLVDKTFESLKVTFSNKLTSTTKYSSSLVATLGSAPADVGSDACTFDDVAACHEDDSGTECSVTYNQPFKFISAKDYNFIIQIHSKRTIKRTLTGTKNDTLFIFPTLEISLD